MKNANFKNAVISGVMAIFLGVLLLGANAVFGATPTLNPPGTGISPTFTGLTVTGTSNLQNLSATGNVSVSGSTSSKSLTAMNGLTVQDGQIFVGSSDVSVSPLIIWSLANAQNALIVRDVNGDDKFSIKIESGMVKIYNDYNGSGLVNSIGLQGQNVKVEGNANLNSGKEIYFADNGQIRSSDDYHRILFRRSENKIELREYGDIVFSPGSRSATPETAKVTMKGDGSVAIGTTVPKALLTVNGEANINGKLKFTDSSDPTGFVDIGALNGDFNVYNDLNVTGHLKAYSLGKYIIRETPTPVSITTGNGGSASINCQTGEQILSCQAKGASNIAINASEISNNTCYVMGKNTGTFTQTIRAQAMCFASNKI